MAATRQSPHRGSGLEGEHGDPKEDEEQEEALCRIAKPVAFAGICGQLASLDHQDARVQEDERQIRQCGEGSVFLPPHWLEAKVEPEEGYADKESYDHTRLLSLPADHQHPARQRQLAAHLERLPPE
eukprot:1613663-Prymnesium_polylepis.1